MSVFMCYNSSINFNPRPCVRGDPKGKYRLVEVNPFQSTPLREGRPVPLPTTAPVFNFNPRPCVRGDATLEYYIQTSKVFQSTPLREGRRYS